MFLQLQQAKWERRGKHDTNKFYAGGKAVPVIQYLLCQRGLEEASPGSSSSGIGLGVCSRAVVSAWDTKQVNSRGLVEETTQ